MAEGRMLKRRITASKKMAALKTDKARLLWLFMLPFTDVDGRIVADCEDIRDEIIRKQRKGYSINKIEECLQDLYRVGLIALYSVNGVRYLELTRFWDEQSHNRNREADSPIPTPTQGTLSERSESNPLKLSKVKLSKDKYGEFVFLSKEEYQKLLIRYGEPQIKILLQELNCGIGSKGYKYKSHYYTLLNWARRKEIPILPTADPKATAERLEKKRQEMRDEFGSIYREMSIEKLRAELEKPRMINHRWLIKEILKEK